jgi:hypothetical protein
MVNLASNSLHKKFVVVTETEVQALISEKLAISLQVRTKIYYRMSFSS